MNNIIQLPKRFYCEKSWNCYHLAAWIRQKYSTLKALPTTFLKPESFNKYNEQLEYLLKQHAIKIQAEFKDFDLILMLFESVYCLGTLINNQVIYMGATQAAQQALERLEPYIISFYRY